MTSHLEFIVTFNKTFTLLYLSQLLNALNVILNVLNAILNVLNAILNVLNAYSLI